MLRFLMALFCAVSALCCGGAPSPPVEDLQEIVVSGGEPVDVGEPLLARVPASADDGFNFPYFVFLPRDLPRERAVRLLVEPNNTGTTTDDFQRHLESARDLAVRGHAHHLAARLGVPLLVPVFPRPARIPNTYTQALDSDTLLIREGELQRIDLQLLAMVRHATGLLERSGLWLKPGLIMHGFSASGTFVNRFAALHPGAVRAVAAGGINGLPILPRDELRGSALPFPIGVADVAELTGAAFDRQAYDAVRQYVYMGYLDRNDTLPYDDAWNDDERELILRLFGDTMMPDRWEESQRILNESGAAVQCVTYDGTSHMIRPEMLDDLVEFFRANDGDERVEIDPHEYEFVAFEEIRTARVNGLYWTGDPRLPEPHRQLGQASFAIGIENWLEGQDYQQLSTFFRNAGFEFVLKAQGHPDLEIGPQNFAGTRSHGSGAFQAFSVRLDDEHLAAIESGVPYTLHPVRQDDEYSWTVNEGVTLVRP